MRRFSRLLPHPLASLSLWAIWLIMNSTLSPAHMLLGAFLGLAIPALTRSLWPEKLHLRRAARFARLLVVVIYDIVLANLHVARLVLGPAARLRPAWVMVPLELTSPYAISMLASIITLTPGTVSAALSADRRTLIVHALHVHDSVAVTNRIKSRYEAPLMEILQ
jgi:multicomponent K+:H+ antiporter subunit E